MSKQLFLCGLFLLILSFFYMTKDIIKVDAYQGEISIIFEFGTREYCYNTSEHELDTNFYFKSELNFQKKLNYTNNFKHIKKF